MYVIIAGGSGLIGRELISTLVVGGHDVSILSRNPEKVKGIPADVRILQWDGKTLEIWAGEISKSDVIVNLAGDNLSGKGLFPSRWTKHRKELLLRSRVDAGKVLSRAIEIADKIPSIFVQASGVGIYGNNRERIYSEESEIGNDFLANLSKEWEASSGSVEMRGIRRVITRFGVVLSNKGGAFRPILFPYKFYVGGPIGDGQQVYSWIHIKDVAGAIKYLIEYDQAKGVFNLTSPNPTSNDEFGSTIGRVYRRPHYLPIPRFLMNLAFGEVANMVLEGQRVLPEKLLDIGYKFKYPTLDEALTDLVKNKSSI